MNRTTFVLLFIVLTVGCPANESAATNSLSKDARTAVHEYWMTRFEDCGESTWYARVSLLFAQGRLHYVEVKEPSISVTPVSLTRADELNGVQWKGTTHLEAAASRRFLFKRKAWTDYWPGLGALDNAPALKPGDYVHTLSVEAVKRNDTWTFESGRQTIEPVGCEEFATYTETKDEIVESYLKNAERLAAEGICGVAMDAYNAALAEDPENEKARTYLEKFKAQLMVSEKQFSQVREGMTFGEVERLLGKACLGSQRVGEEEATWWYYTKTEGLEGRPAMVVFHREGSGGDFVVARAVFRTAN